MGAIEEKYYLSVGDKAHDFERNTAELFSPLVLIKLKKKPYVKLKREHTEHEWKNT